MTRRFIEIGYPLTIRHPELIFATSAITRDLGCDLQPVHASRVVTVPAHGKDVRIIFNSGNDLSPLDFSRLRVLDFL